MVPKEEGTVLLISNSNFYALNSQYAPGQRLRNIKRNWGIEMKAPASNCSAAAVEKYWGASLEDSSGFRVWVCRVWIGLRRLEKAQWMVMERRVPVCFQYSQSVREFTNEMNLHVLPLSSFWTMDDHEYATTLFCWNVCLFYIIIIIIYWLGWF